jgi:group I intron endonuclease
MIIYCILFPNGKRYIGKTEKDLMTRKKAHKHHSKASNRFLYNAVKRYGWENLDWIILEECDDIDTLNFKEKEWIKKFDSMNGDKGYNLREGGEGGRHTEETKQKISAANKGSKNGMCGKTPWNKGKTLSKEHRRKLSESHMGHVPWNKGKKLPPRGPRSSEVKEKISKANGGSNNGMSKINEEIANNIREEYAQGGVTQKDLAEKYGCSSYIVWSVVNNKRWRKNE